MCGIAGALVSDRLAAEFMVGAMNAQMHSRGPDDEGTWSVQTDSSHWLALGSRRLAIIDTSAFGHQPMVDEETGVAIVYNGMTYNFRQLRSSLESAGATFKSTSDTEVVLKLYLQRGTDAIAALDGMFGVAIWDPRTRTLLVARDRLGIKPLYFAVSDGSLVFASQVRAILSSGAVPMHPNVAGIQDYLATGATSDPRTVVAGIEAVGAGDMLLVRGGRIEHSKFWRPGWSVRNMPWQEAVVGFRDRLESAVGSHLISDVSTSVFLSGGLDSSVIAALAAKHSPSIHSVSVVFAEQTFDEGHYSRLVARRVGTEHHEVTLASSNLASMLPGVFAAMDQPTIDGVNTFVVAAAARDAGYKVALSGLGADELLDGYGMVRRIRILTAAGRMPRAVRGFAARRLSDSAPLQRKAAAWLVRPGDVTEAHTLLRALFLPEEVTRLVPATTGVDGSAQETGSMEFPGLASEVAWLDMVTYMRNVLLRDTDCMCMGNSLELRVPYLDNSVVDFAMSLPMAVRSRRKRLIADAFHEFLPPEVIGRRKQGFALPIGPWMTSSLRDAVASRLGEPPEGLRSLFDRESVQGVWDNFQHTHSGWLRPWSLFALFTWWTSTEVELRNPRRPN